MRSLSLVVFGKTKVCPPSEALLLNSKTTLTGVRSDAINTHLSECDFCGAETQLLTKHPPSTVAISTRRYEMPIALRHLAEGLMIEPSLNRASRLDSEQLSEAICDF
jgi:hypothetical protein